MSARPEQQHTAATAVWSARLATLPIALLIVAALSSRFGLIDEAPLLAVVAIAWALALLVVVLGVLACRTIWIEGEGGLRSAAYGIILGLLVLTMPAAVIFGLTYFPRLSDISTDTDDPPDLPGRPHGGDVVAARLQAEAYPDLVSRHYPVAPGRVFTEALALATQRGWLITEGVAPDSERDDVGVLSGTAWTLVFALPVDIAIRVVPDAAGTLVDMRSASRVGVHDLGDNARRIRSFFADLDVVLQGVAPGDDAEPQPEGEETAPPAPPEPPKKR